MVTQDRGGPVDVVRALAGELHRSGGADVRVFGPPPARGLTPDLTDVWTESGVGTKGDVGGARALLDRARAWGADVLHAHDRRAALVVGGAVLRRRHPLLIQTYHGVPEDVSERWFRGEPGAAAPSRYTRATLAADAAFARVLDINIVPAQPMRRFLAGRLRVPAARLHQINNGLELGAPEPPSGPVRRLLVVGILLERKGIGDLLEALARPGVFPHDARLTIAGDGPERAAIEARIARPDLAGKVEMLGFRSDVPQLMRDSDAVVVPSRMEQQPLVVIEAMAAGKPVLATDTGDAATMLDAPGAARHLAVPGDVDSLAGALRGLFDDPDPADTGKRLAARAAELYSARACAEAHVELYARLVAA